MTLENVGFCVENRTLCSNAWNRAASPFQEPPTQAVGAKARSSIQPPPSLAGAFGQRQPSSSGRGAKGAIPVCAGSVSIQGEGSSASPQHCWEVAAAGTGCALPVVSQKQRMLCITLAHCVHPEGILLWLHVVKMWVKDSRSLINMVIFASGFNVLLDLLSCLATSICREGRQHRLISYGRKNISLVGPWIFLTFMLTYCLKGLTIKGSEKSGKFPTSRPAKVQTTAVTEHSTRTAMGHSAIIWE